jgi:hypothetical protein
VRKHNVFTAAVLLLSAIFIVGSRSRAGADPLALLQPEVTTNPAIESTGTCVPSSTVACVQGNRFELSVLIIGSGLANVAASNGVSAVFYFPSGGSGDWQVVAKILNGCSSTNTWWVFAAGATSTTYNVQVHDTVTNISYGFSDLCPLENKVAIPCP